MKEEIIAICNLLIDLILTLVGKNNYTQSSKREQVFSGYSDCSSLMQAIYMRVMNIDIGDNTEAQILSKKLKDVPLTIKNGIPDITKMQKGDLLYFRGNDTSRSASRYVGHVEMYIGDGKLCGHGSGTGPTIKNMNDYCKSRQERSSEAPAGNRGLICVRRAVDLFEDSPQKEELKISTEGVSFMRDLVKGDKGYGEIATLQRCLKSMGYYTGKIDRSFGGLTEEAVKAFQADHDIKVNYPGTVGPKTWTVLLTQC